MADLPATERAAIEAALVEAADHFNFEDPPSCRGEFALARMVTAARARADAAEAALAVESTRAALSQTSTDRERELEAECDRLTVALGAMERKFEEVREQRDRSFEDYARVRHDNDVQRDRADTAERVLGEWREEAITRQKELNATRESHEMCHALGVEARAERDTLRSLAASAAGALEKITHYVELRFSGVAQADEAGGLSNRITLEDERAMRELVAEVQTVMVQLHAAGLKGEGEGRMSKWSGLDLELEGVRKAVRNLKGDPEEIAAYVVDRACAYVGPFHEANAATLIAEALRALTPEPRR